MNENECNENPISVKEISRNTDLTSNIFDGQKADLFINTGKLGGKIFMVTVNQPDGTPVLIAVHL